MVIESMKIRITNELGKSAVCRTRENARIRPLWVQRIGWFILTVGARIMLGGNKYWETICNVQERNTTNDT